MPMPSITDQKQKLTQEILELWREATRGLERRTLEILLNEAMLFVASESTLSELKAWKVQLMVESE